MFQCKMTIRRKKNSLSGDKEFSESKNNYCLTTLEVDELPFAATFTK